MLKIYDNFGNWIRISVDLLFGKNKLWLEAICFHSSEGLLKLDCQDYSILLSMSMGHDSESYRCSRVGSSFNFLNLSACSVLRGSIDASMADYFY